MGCALVCLAALAICRQVWAPYPQLSLDLPAVLCASLARVLQLAHPTHLSPTPLPRPYAVFGKWQGTEKTFTVPDPLNGEPFIHVRGRPLFCFHSLTGSCAPFLAASAGPFRSAPSLLTFVRHLLVSGPEVSDTKLLNIGTFIEKEF